MSKRKSIINKLKLAYAPLTGYEFAKLKTDPFILQAMEDACVYVIAQRPVISFENLRPGISGHILKFEIHQRGNPNILECDLSLNQKAIECDLDDDIAIATNSLIGPSSSEFPFFNLFGFSLIKKVKSGSEFLIWFSPEKLLQNWWCGQIECDIVGDYKSFLKYKVHYVGKATKQNILKRLTGHSTFQDILSLENPINYKDIPSHEIAVLCFKFQENLEIQSFDYCSDTKAMSDALLNKYFPSKDSIFLDAEKALIKSMKPLYNKSLFKSYPKSKDGLYKDNYDYISYSFADPITLSYNQGTINGSLDYNGGDLIIINGNKEMSLFKYNNI